MTSVLGSTSVPSADRGGRKARRRCLQRRSPTSLLATIRDWAARRRRRRSLAALSELDDHMLKDIGLSRQEAVRECAKWFWQE